MMPQHQGSAFHYKLFTYPNPKPQESALHNALLVREDDDLEDANSIFSDDQSLYVLFQPVSNASSTNTHNVHESDILSLTDTATNNTPRAAPSVASDAGNAPVDSSSRHTITVPPQDTLSSRIENWNESSFQQDELIDDNTASWDLDEGLSTSTYFDRAFYGDDLFKHMSSADFSKFIKIHQQNKVALNPKMDQMVWRYLQRSRTQPYTSSKTLDYLSTFTTLEASDTNTTNSLVLCGGSNPWSDH